MVTASIHHTSASHGTTHHVATHCKVRHLTAHHITSNTQYIFTCDIPVCYGSTIYRICISQNTTIFT